MPDKTREEFEEYARGRYDLRTWPDGSYSIDETIEAWEVWQASRGADSAR